MADREETIRTADGKIVRGERIDTDGATQRLNANDANDRNNDGVADRSVSDRTVATDHVEEEPRHAAAVPVDDGRTVRQQVVDREKEEFGGFKFGSAFFGWLTATGTAVLLTALVAGLGTALGLGAADSTEEAVNGATQNADTIGIVGAIAVLVILFVAYYCGGYVAGRMARFSGAKQGIAVWLWALIIAIVVAIIGAIAGSQFDILANLNSFPRLPFGEGELTTVGILTAVGALLVSLGGAVLGGVAGMRFHRRVDRAGLGK